MKHYIPLILIVLFILFSYWMIVMSVKTQLQGKANEYGWKGLAYRCTNEKKSDSLMTLFYHYSQRADNTLKLIPKFSRP